MIRASRMRDADELFVRFKLTEEGDCRQLTANGKT